MPETVNIHQAKTHFSKLVERAHAGEEIIVAKSGVPYARLVPLDAPARSRRRLGLLGRPLSAEAARESLRPLEPQELAGWE